VDRTCGLVDRGQGNETTSFALKNLSRQAKVLGRGSSNPNIWNSFRAPDGVVEKGSYYISHNNNYGPDKASISFVCLLFQAVDKVPHPEYEGDNIDK
jgi:hypothetical protein